MKSMTLKVLLLLFCATILLSTGTGCSLSVALSRSVVVCLVAGAWGLVLRAIYLRMIHPAQYAAQYAAQAKGDEGIGERSTIAHEDAA